MLAPVIDWVKGKARDTSPDKSGAEVDTYAGHDYLSRRISYLGERGLVLWYPPAIIKRDIDYWNSIWT